MNIPRLPSVKDAGKLTGKRVLLRVGFNVPIEEGAVTNQFRLMRALPTISYLREEGARIVIIAHIGRDKEETLKPVYEALRSQISLKWCPDLSGKQTREAVQKLEDGEVLLLENLRQDERETANDPSLAKELAEYADLYVNDAFAASHRAHASLVEVPKLLPSYFGFNFITEYEELQKAMEPEKPSLFILGGAKFETKLPLVEQYAQKYDQVFIGGAHANDIFAAKGLEVGESLVSGVNLTDSVILNRLNILLPIDVTVKGKTDNRVTKPEDVRPDENILDAGPKSVEMLAKYIKEAKTILWNGPLGDYEKGFDKVTLAVAKEISQAPGYSVVGGGDTVASIQSLNLQDKFGFLSTAGGAMLTFLEKGSLPAIDAILNKED